MGLSTADVIKALPRAPVCLPQHLDPTKSELAFEERMLPKLNRECKSSDIKDRQRALKSLTDIVHSPERISETIQVGLYGTVGDLLNSDDDMCRNLAAEIFSIMSQHNIGRVASIKFIPNLAKLFTDTNIQTRVFAHKSLFCLADIRQGMEAIVENKLVRVLIELISSEEDVVKIWTIQTLSRILRIAAQEALDNNGLETLAQLTEQSKDAKIVEYAVRAISEITYPHAGKARANSHESLAGTLVEIVQKRGNESLRAAAAAAISAMAITTEGKWNFYKLHALDACCELLQDTLSESRLNAITAISIIAEVPNGRWYILDNKIDQIKALTIDPHPLVRQAAIECCKVVEWKP